MLNQLRALPRDSRDSLFLLLVVAWIIAPHTAHLPLWCSGLAGSLLLWRGWLALGTRRLPSWKWLLPLLLVSVLATAASFRSLHGRDAGVTLIVALLALKMLELRARRDALVVFFLGFFVMLTHFFYSQSLLTAGAVLLGLLGLLTALVNSHLPAGRPPLAQSAWIAARMLLLGAPIMALLFLLFPRVAPLWGSPNDPGSARSGLSATLQVGNIAQLALDDSVVMRLRFEGAQPLPQELYFRGPVLSSFDGREWTALQPTFAPRHQPAAQLEVSGPALRYEATLEPTRRPWLLVLDAAPEAPQSPALPGGGARMTTDLQWLARAPLTDVLRYTAHSHPQFRHGPTRNIAGLQDYLSLPPGFNPRTGELARQLLAQAHRAGAEVDAGALVEAALTRLRDGGYRYTLEPGVFGPHTADEFWFERKEGFCEHIASAFVVLMRYLGIPARIVTGYQGGEHNAVGDFWVVRQSDAHAWTEVWLAGRGWVRVDPTAAVAPGRIGALQRLSAPRGVLATAIGAVSPGLALNLRALWDATNHRWNQWVLNYTASRQLDLLRSLGFRSPGWEDLATVLLACIVLALATGLLGLHWQRRRRDPWLQLLDGARQRLRRAGLALPPQAPPREMARLLAAQSAAGNAGLRDNQLHAIGDWLLRLEAQRYALADEENRRRALRRLQREAKQLSWPT